ncbi:sensor histidine kinase, partial [Halochromatium sp.]
DLVQIEQVLLNLVRNALDALEETAPGRRALIVSTRRLGDRALVCVHDNGPGISPQRMDQLFDPFFTTKESGMGMGLPISLTILEDHDGTIRAESQPGSGALFEVELPIALEDAAATEGQATAAMADVRSLNLIERPRAEGTHG